MMCFDKNMEMLSCGDVMDVFFIYFCVLGICLMELCVNIFFFLQKSSLFDFRILCLIFEFSV
jgi:hypothetical protein